MVDNVPITAGSGTVIASDDIGGVQHQRVKIGLGADGTAVDMVGGTGVDGTGVPRVTLATDVPLPAGANNIGDVDVLSLPATPAGTNLIGRVKPEGDEYERVAASQTTQALGASPSSLKSSAIGLPA